MAHLTKPTKYNVEDSNIALLGSDLEKRVREHGGDKEAAWVNAGQQPGIQIWRIEKFHPVTWPQERVGNFYDGDSYIVLHTYKKTPEADSLSYDLHFWLGEDTSQDEAGTAAYKTVELDDHLNGAPTQYREVQGNESPRFLSYFPRFVCQKGGVSTGFHHVSEAPPPDVHKLYRITISKVHARSNIIVREVPAEASSLVEGDVFVLDKGSKIWQYNTKESAGQEKFKAAEFVQSLAASRNSQCDVTVYDEGGSGAGIFLLEFGEGTTLRKETPAVEESTVTLFRVSDSTGTVSFEAVEPAVFSSLSSSDAFLVDDASAKSHPAMYVWLGHESSLKERRLAVQYAQQYLHDKRARVDSTRVAIPIVKLREGNESEDFLQVMGH